MIVMMVRIGAVLVVLGAVTQVFAAESGLSTKPESKLATVKKAVVEKLHGLSDTFKVKKVEPNRWKDVIQGVNEIQGRVAEIRQSLQELQTKSETAKISQDEFNKDLDSILEEFNRLAEEAGTETNLPEPLAKYAPHEKEMWLHWSKVTVNVKEVYARALERIQNQTALSKRIDPMLTRFDRGAKNILTLASVLNTVDQMDKLSQMAEQVNLIINAFDALANQTKDAIAQIENGTSMSQESPNLRPIPERVANRSQLQATQVGYQTIVDEQGRQVVVPIAPQSIPAPPIDSGWQPAQ
jgi:hypothetical protein